MIYLKYSHLKHLRNLLVTAKRLIYKRIYKMDIDDTVNFSLSAKFDKTNPRGVHIGAYSYIAFDVAILTHDFTRGIRAHTTIGKNCFIGARSIVLPGVSVGDGVIVGAGSIVTKDIPPYSIAAGNPAKVIKRNTQSGKYGRFLNADDVQRQQTIENNLG